jgi:heme-degrading monooxygenase HmoA
MTGPAYTLAMYRVRAGDEDEFLRAWDELATTFSSLFEPPISGTLIRSTSDPRLFYSFGPWRSAEHVAAMRANPAAGQAFGTLRALCEELVAGDYELVRHLDVQLS